MKTVILAGGYGTRLAEETSVRPKPMVEIGGRPILWHIMRVYAHYGFDQFVVACGYKGAYIKEYFTDFVDRESDFSVNLKTGQKKVLNPTSTPWEVTLIDTGIDTQTGGRIKRLQPYLEDQRFMCTYGDGVGSVDIKALLAFHESHGKAVTLTAVRPPARFGSLILEDGAVREFSEKPQGGEGWINGGFFVMEPRVFEYLEGDRSVLERVPLERLAEDEELMAFQHEGFWQPMDTLRDKKTLEGLWDSGQAPWKLW